MVMKVETTQAILDNTPAVIYIKDLQGRYLLINRQFEVLFHVLNEKVLGKNDFDLFPLKMAQKFRTNDLQVLEMGRAIEFEEVAPHDDGEHTYISIKFPVYGEGQRPFGICGISTDITERKRAEEILLKARSELEQRVQERTYELMETNAELRRMNQELVELNEVNTEMASIVSHELKTPLNAIRQALELVLDEVEGGLNSSQKETLLIAQNNVDRMARLIGDILDLNRIKRGTLHVFLEKVNLNELVGEAFRSMKPMVERKGIAFLLELPSEEVVAVCDHHRMHQLIMNLIDNALKFTQRSGTISVGLENSGEKVGIFVEDSGLGVRQEERQKIFQLFQKGSASLLCREGGMGIGLAVCQQIAQQHQGELTLEPVSPQGSRFIFSFPKDLPLSPPLSL